MATIEGKAICFGCRYIEVGGGSVPAPRCPRCGYPLILNSASVSLSETELEQVFRMLVGPYSRRGGGLPGISAPKPRRQRRMTPVVTPLAPPEPPPPPIPQAPPRAETVGGKGRPSPAASRVMTPINRSTATPQAAGSARTRRRTRKWLLA
jgi:hypothetical protein